MQYFYMTFFGGLHQWRPTPELFLDFCSYIQQVLNLRLITGLNSCPEVRLESWAYEPSFIRRGSKEVGMHIRPSRRGKETPSPRSDALQQPRSPDLSRRDALQQSRSATSFAAATSRLAASSATVSSRPLCRLVCFSVVKLCIRPFLLCQNLVDEVGDIWVWVANPSPPKSETYNDVTIHR